MLAVERFVNVILAALHSFLGRKGIIALRFHSAGFYDADFQLLLRPSRLQIRYSQNR